MRGLFVLLTASLLATPLFAQTDSVIVTGRIRNLSARLYRDAPTVLIARNNILQASRELVRPAPLAVDGSFRVAVPLIYPQEELYFNYGRISTAFLAVPGTVTIDLNADSLFTTSVPFQFGGVNARINQEYARYKAFEATYTGTPKPEALSTAISGPVTVRSFTTLTDAYGKALAAFRQRQPLLPLTDRWLGSVNTYNAAAFFYDRLIYGGGEEPDALGDQLRPASDPLLTGARAIAMNRFATYATQTINEDAALQRGAGLSVQKLAQLLLRFSPRLSEAERQRLNEFSTRNEARNSDLRFFDGLVKRSNDTIQRLINYDLLIQRATTKFDTPSVNYLTAYWLATSLPALTIRQANVLYAYARPRITESALGQSLDELYRLETGDSTAVWAANSRLAKAGPSVAELEVSPGVFVTRNAGASGQGLFDQVVNANRGKLIYVLLTTPDTEAGRQAALDAQRLRDAYSARDMALIYLPDTSTNPALWPELATRNKLEGDHLLLTGDQLADVASRLRSGDGVSGTLISRVGKIIKRNAPLPGAFEEAKRLIDRNL